MSRTAGAVDRFTVDSEAGAVSVAWHRADGPTTIVTAQGAGGTMDSPVLVAYAEAVAARDVGCVRFNFAYSEQGKRAPDRAAKLEAVWLAVAAHVAGGADRLVLGGRSMGGRYASHIVADTPAAGIVFLAYPLHPPGKFDRVRDAPLFDVEVPMLFLQGSRDPFARADLLDATIDGLGERATLHRLDGGDHSHRVKGRPQADVMAELADVSVAWMERLR